MCNVHVLTCARTYNHEYVHVYRMYHIRTVTDTTTHVYSHYEVVDGDGFMQAFANLEFSTGNLKKNFVKDTVSSFFVTGLQFWERKRVKELQFWEHEKVKEVQDEQYVQPPIA
jgi:hypothetical protein